MGMLSAAATGEAMQMRPWVWPVAIPTSSDAGVQKSARMLADSLKVPYIQIDRNPVCCLWIEVDQWSPNPKEAAYIILLQEGGGSIIASDASQLQMAVARLMQLREGGDDRPLVPHGLITNYSIIQ